MGVEYFGVMVPIIIVITIPIIVIYLRRYENEERMAMIEKGVDPALFATKKKGSSSLPLRLSLLFVGAGLGLLMGYFLDRAYHMEEVAYFSMLFIFGGLGLGAAYIIEEKKYRQEEEREARALRNV